ncbi:hypothetical protein [Spiroplasma turonicum]|uniref:Transmembrane protein n=1 Tax=Spiroplasma turonicum TaxID=216946 RepID=A0A0K1P7M4_9MOLU|nr:hypothetical protein [Spiroplasma turonicum]AKU80194.1 hypothetical protein STURON_00948 [Spiroplasma turonicum]ALX71194.1 hypothetical protein STURO_v1c09430 [Spiroplasma turonicum]
MAKQKMKKSKEVLEKLKYKKYSPSNIILNTIIATTRIIMLVFAFAAPALFILAIIYDQGIRSLFLFCLSLIVYQKGHVYEQSYNNIAWWVFIPCAILILIICFILGLAFPFISKNSWNQRAVLAFNLLFWPILFGSIIYIINYTIPYFGSFGEVGSSSSIDENNVVDWYYNALKNNYSYTSFWMIIIQSIYVIIFGFGIFTIFEADLARRYKIFYFDERINNPDNYSMYNHVLEGKLNFGEVEGTEIGKELKRLNKEERDYQENLRINYIMELKKKRHERKNAKKSKHNKKT